MTIIRVKRGLRPAAGGGGNFTPDSGWSNASIDGSNNLTITRNAADLGSGPTLALYADFRGGTPGSVISSTPTIGAAFTHVTDSLSANTNNGANKPFYTTGPDGATWMNCLNSSLIAANAWAQIEIDFGSNFDSWYMSLREYTDGVGGGSTNQKDAWFCYNADVTGSTHDVTNAAYRQMAFGNSMGGNAIYTDDSSGDAGNSTPPNGGFFSANTDSFVQWGMRPHSGSAVLNALVDTFIHAADPANGRLLFKSTGNESIWQNNVSPFAVNYLYLPGYFQDQEASHTGNLPHATKYLRNDVLIQIGANSQKRFFVTNASTLAASTFMADCPATSWAAGQVTLKKPGSISSWAGYYVWYADWLTFTRAGLGT